MCNISGGRGRSFPAKKFDVSSLVEAAAAPAESLM